MSNGDTTKNVYKRKTVIKTEAKTSAMTTPLKVNFHYTTEKTNTYVRDEKEFLLSKQFRKAKIKGRFSLGQHMNKDVIFNDYDAQNKNYTNLILLSQQKRSLRKEINEINTPEIYNTSYITNDIQTVVHKKGKLSSYIINPRNQKQFHNIIKPSKSTETLKQEVARTPLRNSKQSSQVTDNRMKHKNNSQYTIHIPGGVFNSRSRSKKAGAFQTPYRPPNVSSNTGNTNGVYTGTSPYQNVFLSPVTYSTFSEHSCKTNITPLKNSSEKVIEVMKGSNSGGKVDFIRRFEFFDYIKKYKMNKVIFIQRMYKERYAIRYRKVVLIQSFVRMFLSRQLTENYIKQYYYFLAAYMHIETIAKRKARLRDVFYKIKIQAMLNTEYAAYIDKYNKGKRNDRFKSLYEKAIVEIDSMKQKLYKSEGKYKSSTFNNVEIANEVNAFNINGTDEKKTEQNERNNTDNNVDNKDIFSTISLKHKKPIKRKIVNDIETTKEDLNTEQLVESEILINNDVDDEVVPISKLRSKRRQPTDTISSQMNTEDNFQSEAERSKRFKSKKNEKRSLTIDKNVNISLTNKVKCFDTNCFDIEHEEVDMKGRNKEKMKISNEDRFVLDRYYEKVNLEKIKKKKMKELKISKDRGFSMGKLKKTKSKLDISNMENVLFEGKQKKKNQFKIDNNELMIEKEKKNIKYKIDNNELTIEKEKKEKPIYEIESIDIIIEDNEPKKKILKSKRKPQNNNKLKISSESISLSSDIPTETSITKIKQQLYNDKLSNISIAKKNISLCIKNTKDYNNKSIQTSQSSNEITSLSSLLIKSSPKPKIFDTLKPQYHKSTLSIGSTPKTPTFNQKELKPKSSSILSLIGSKPKSSFESIKPRKENKISLTYNNKSFSSLSSSKHQSICYNPDKNYTVNKFTKNNSPTFINEITIEQEKKKITDNFPIIHTNNNLSISSGLNAMELITESNKDSNSDDGNKEEVVTLPSNRSLLNRAYNKYFYELIGNNTNENNNTEGNKSVRTNNNNVSIVSIDNYVMYNMNIDSSSFELIANINNEKLSKAVLPVRLVDIIKRTIGKNVIDCIADRPTEKLKGRINKNNDKANKRALLRATRNKRNKPLKKVFDVWKKKVMQEVIYDTINHKKINELSYNKPLVLSYYDKEDKELNKDKGLNRNDYSIQYPMKLSYNEDRTSIKEKELSFKHPISLSYKEYNYNKNNDELSFKHILALSFYEDKMINKELSFKKPISLSYNEAKMFDKDSLSFKQPISLSYNEIRTTFNEDTLSFKQPVSLSYKEAKTFDKDSLSFKQPVSLSYKEMKNTFNEDTLSFKQPVTLSYKEEKSFDKDSLSFKQLVTLSYKEEKPFDKDSLSFKQPVTLSYKEAKSFDKDSLSFKQPVSLSYKEHRNTFDNDTLSFKQPVSLSYKEMKNTFNEDTLSFKHTLKLSIKDQSKNNNNNQIISKAIKCSYNDKLNNNTKDKDFSYVYPSKLSYYEEKKQNDTMNNNSHPIKLSYSEKSFTGSDSVFKHVSSLSYNELTHKNLDSLSHSHQFSLSFHDESVQSSLMSNNDPIISTEDSTNNNKKKVLKSRRRPNNQKQVEKIQPKEEEDKSKEEEIHSKEDNQPKEEEIHIEEVNQQTQERNQFEEEDNIEIPREEEENQEDNQPDKAKKLKSKRKLPNKEEKPVEEVIVKSNQLNEDNHQKEGDNQLDEEDGKTLITIRQRQVIKVKSRRKSYPIQLIFLKKIFFNRWKTLSPYSPRTIIIRQQRIKKTIQRFPSCSYHDILSYLNLRHCFNKWKKLKSSSYITIHNIHVIVANFERQNLQYLQACFNKWKDLSLMDQSVEEVEFAFSPRTEVNITPKKGIRVKLVQKDKSGLSKTINVKYSSDKKKPKSLNISDKSEKQYKGMKVTKKYVPVNTQNMDKIILFDSSVGELTALKEQLRKLRDIVLKCLKRNSFMKWKVNNNKRRVMLQFLDEFSSNNKKLSKYFLLGMIKNYMNDGRDFKELSDENYKKGIAMLKWYRLRQKTKYVINIKEVTKYRFLKK